MTRPNPYDQPLATANSCYAGYRDGRLILLSDLEGAPSPLAQFVHDQLRAFVLHPSFACVGAKSAFSRETYRFGMYGEMGSEETTAGLARDLFSFVQEQPSFGEGLSSFVACFTGPSLPDELHFERVLWKQLQSLHEIDLLHSEWDPTVSSDSEDPLFSFSFAGRGYFIVGMSPVSSRWTRHFAWPTLVFNAHYQFEDLRKAGKFERFQEVIRNRDRQLQGGINPNLADFGEASEARQYSGRHAEPEWRCPFHAQTKKADANSVEPNPGGAEK